MRNSSQRTTRRNATAPLCRRRDLRGWLGRPIDMAVMPESVISELQAATYQQFFTNIGVPQFHADTVSGRPTLPASARPRPP